MSTRAAIRRNEAKATSSHANKFGTPNRHSSSVPSINGASAFQQNNQLQAYHQQSSTINPHQPYNQHQQHQQQSKKPLTIEQAITLITLRLGRLEVWMQETERQEASNSQPMASSSSSLMNEDLAQNMLERLNALEDAQQQHTQKIPSTTSSQEFPVLKQTVDTLKAQVAKNIKTLQTSIKTIKDDVVNLEKLITNIQVQTASNTAQLEILTMMDENEEMDKNNANKSDQDQNDTTTDEIFGNLEIETGSELEEPQVTVEDEPEEHTDDEQNID